MRNFVLTLLIAGLVSPSVFAQTSPLPMDSSVGLVTYEEVVDLPGFTKAQLYEQTGKWADEYFTNPTRVIKEREPEKGKYTGKHQFHVYSEDKRGNRTKTDLIKFTFKIWLKDGKYRYKISEFNVEKTSYYAIERWLTNEHLSNKLVMGYLNQINDEILKMIESLHEGLKKTEVEVDEDDW